MDGTPLENVDNFTYISSTTTGNCQQASGWATPAPSLGVFPNRSGETDISLFGPHVENRQLVYTAYYSTVVKPGQHTPHPARKVTDHFPHAVPQNVRWHYKKKKNSLEKRDLK